MKNIMKRLKEIWDKSQTYFIWNTIQRFKKMLHEPKPTDEDIEDEKAWEAHEKDREQYYKKNFKMMYYWKKVEAPIMYIGFITFLFDPIFKLGLGEGGSGIYAILRGIQGGAMGLGFASWMSNKGLWKMNFMIQRYTSKFFDKIKEVMEEAEREAKASSKKVIRAD